MAKTDSSDLSRNFGTFGEFVRRVVRYDSNRLKNLSFSERIAIPSPERLSSTTLSLPSLKRRCHSKASFRANVSQSYTCFNISLSPGTFESYLVYLHLQQKRPKLNYTRVGGTIFFLVDM
ncbi:hypothetical protein TNCV_1923481 [Trichonephila clavipes]|nr:hypothetical protein TNCV_1923481 [Trichonephila clavipes]